MIQIPPGFDYTTLFADFFAFSKPFIVIAGIFSAYYVIKKIGRSI